MYSISLVSRSLNLVVCTNITNTTIFVSPLSLNFGAELAPEAPREDPAPSDGPTTRYFGIFAEPRDLEVYDNNVRERVILRFHPNLLEGESEGDVVDSESVTRAEVGSDTEEELRPLIDGIVDGSDGLFDENNRLNGFAPPALLRRVVQEEDLLAPNNSQSDSLEKDKKSVLECLHQPYGRTTCQICFDDKDSSLWFPDHGCPMTHGSDCGCPSVYCPNGYEMMGFDPDTKVCLSCLIRFLEGQLKSKCFKRVVCLPCMHPMMGQRADLDPWFEYRRTNISAEDEEYFLDRYLKEIGLILEDKVEFCKVELEAPPFRCVGAEEFLRAKADGGARADETNKSMGADGFLEVERDENLLTEAHENDLFKLEEEKSAQLLRLSLSEQHINRMVMLREALEELEGTLQPKLAEMQSRVYVMREESRCKRVNCRKCELGFLVEPSSGGESEEEDMDLEEEDSECHSIDCPKCRDHICLGHGEPISFQGMPLKIRKKINSILKFLTTSLLVLILQKLIWDWGLCGAFADLIEYVGLGAVGILFEIAKLPVTVGLLPDIVVPILARVFTMLFWASDEFTAFEGFVIAVGVFLAGGSNCGKNFAKLLKSSGTGTINGGAVDTVTDLSGLTEIGFRHLKTRFITTASIIKEKLQHCLSPDGTYFDTVKFAALSGYCLGEFVVIWLCSYLVLCAPYSAVHSLFDRYQLYYIENELKPLVFGFFSSLYGLVGGIIGGFFGGVGYVYNCRVGLTVRTMTDLLFRVFLVCCCGITYENDVIKQGKLGRRGSMAMRIYKTLIVENKYMQSTAQFQQSLALGVVGCYLGGFAHAIVSSSACKVGERMIDGADKKCVRLVISLLKLPLLQEKFSLDGPESIYHSFLTCEEMDSDLMLTSGGNVDDILNDGTQSSQRAQARKDQEFIDRTTSACPKCNTKMRKSNLEHCNKMKCMNCNTKYCYACRTPYRNNAVSACKCKYWGEVPEWHKKSMEYFPGFGFLR